MKEPDKGRYNQEGRLWIDAIGSQHQRQLLTMGERQKSTREMHFRRHRTCCTKGHPGYKGYGLNNSAMDMATTLVTGTNYGLLSIGHATQRNLGLDRGGHGQLWKDWSAVRNPRNHLVS